MFAKELTIFTDKVYRDKYEAIEEIAHLPNEFVNNNDEYAKAVIDRENVIATYIVMILQYHMQSQLQSIMHLLSM